MPLQRQADMHTHAHTCMCAHTMLMYHLGSGVGEAFTETCTHAHTCTCAHTMLMYEHSYRHMAMDTQYTCVHTNLQRLRKRPVVSQPLQDWDRKFLLFWTPASLTSTPWSFVMAAGIWAFLPSSHRSPGTP